MNIRKPVRNKEENDNARKIDRVINNNVVVVLDYGGKEIVLMGKGLGFQKKANDILDEEKVEKTFVLSNQPETSHFLQMVREIPYEYVEISSEIISYAETMLNKQLNNSIYLLLTDHLNFAIERAYKGIVLPNSLLWEIKHYYSSEFEIGKEALIIIKNHTGLELSVDEAGFIAMHILNSEIDLDMSRTREMTALIQNVLNIIRYHFQIVIDEESIDYERFVTHLKFFIQRSMHAQHSRIWEKELMDMVCVQYKEAFQCAKKVKEYIERTTIYEVKEEELVYLCVHIQRLWRASS